MADGLHRDVQGLHCKHFDEASCSTLSSQTSRCLARSSPCSCCGLQYSCRPLRLHLQRASSDPLDSSPSACKASQPPPDSARGPLSRHHIPVGLQNRPHLLGWLINQLQSEAAIACCLQLLQMPQPCKCIICSKCECPVSGQTGDHSYSIKLQRPQQAADCAPLCGESHCCGAPSCAPLRHTESRRQGLA